MKKTYFIAILLFLTTNFLVGQRLTKYDKKFRIKNKIGAEFLGGSGFGGIFYERHIYVGSMLTIRPRIGVTPSYTDERFEFFIGKNITAIGGVGFFLFPHQFKLGLEVNVLTDYFFKSIPETDGNLQGTHGIPDRPVKHIRARIMPAIIGEIYASRVFNVSLGYSPILDPINDDQTEFKILHTGLLRLGFRFN